MELDPEVIFNAEISKEEQEFIDRVRGLNTVSMSKILEVEDDGKIQLPSEVLILLKNGKNNEIKVKVRVNSTVKECESNKITISLEHFEVNA